MPIIERASGERGVSVEVRVSGTPAEVWDAIATGPGISSWFVDTDFESVDGMPRRMRNDFGPGMQSVSEITSWDPPRAFTSNSADLGADAPLVHTKWSVEPSADGGCTVRVDHAVRTDRRDWDAHLAAWEGGWPAFFHLLQLRLEHFRGLPSASCQFSAVAELDAEHAWARLASDLGVEGIAEGDAFRAAGEAPPLAGCVARASEARERVLLLETPTPGLAHVFAMPTGARSSLWLRLNIFDPQAAERLEHERAAWRDWLERTVSAPTPGSPS